MKNTLILLITFNIFSQDQEKIKFTSFKIINNNTNAPVANVNIYSNDTLITQSNVKGVFEINNKTKTITFRKNYYYDQNIEIEKINNNQIILDSIISYQLEEVVVSKSKKFLDQVYSNYVNKNNYKLNYKFQNKNITLYTDAIDIVNIDQLFVMDL